ncbi:MAG: urate hydroxylase PuuD, partial [Bacteroidota bacterium]
MTQEIVLTFLRWLHVVAGIFWLGVGYTLLFALLPALSGLATDVRQAIASTVQRRMFTFLRWGSLLAWFTGVVLLGMLYHGGGRMFDDSAAGWNAAAGISVLAVFLAFAVYDVLAKMSFFADIRRLGALAYLATIALVEIMSGPAGMGYSAVLIHIGTMFGTIMVANVWMRIWPAQRASIAAHQEGRPADELRLQEAALRTR